MRSLCLVVLIPFLTVTLSSGQNHPEAKGSDNKTAQTDDNSKHNSSPPVQGGGPHRADKATDTEKESQQQSRPWLTHGEWVMAILTFVYVVITGFYAWTSHRTLKEIERQTERARGESDARDKQFAEQLKVSRDAADAALLNARAVINSERAWIFADILPTIGNGRFVDLENGNTSIYVRINCKNVGRSPAWIIEARARFMFIETDKLPPVPPLEDAEQVWAGTHPIGPKDEPFSTGDYTLTAHGIQGIDSVTGEWAVIYGVIRYRDIFQKARQTTFGYRLMPGTDTRFTRLINYPKYNESS